MEQQISKTEWISDKGKCDIVVTLTGDVEEYDIIEQAKFTVKGLGFSGGVEEGDEDELEQN